MTMLQRVCKYSLTLIKRRKIVIFKSFCEFPVLSYFGLFNQFQLCPSIFLSPLISLKFSNNEPILQMMVSDKGTILSWSVLFNFIPSALISSIHKHSFRIFYLLTIWMELDFLYLMHVIFMLNRYFNIIYITCLKLSHIYSMWHKIYPIVYTAYSICTWRNC